MLSSRLTLHVVAWYDGTRADSGPVGIRVVRCKGAIATRGEYRSTVPRFSSVCTLESEEPGFSFEEGPIHVPR